MRMRGRGLQQPLQASKLVVGATLRVDDQIECSASTPNLSLLLAGDSSKLDHSHVSITDICRWLMNEDEASLHRVEIAVIGLQGAFHG